MSSDGSGCILCRGRQEVFLAVDERFSLARCADCGHVATTPALPEADLAPFYPTAYYGARNRRFNLLFERLIVLFRFRRGRLIERRARKGRMLDVGCGRGLLPYLMRLRGWEAHGLEVSAIAAEHARDVLGVPVHVGRIEEGPWEPGSFEAVVFWHVLEHVREPRSALRCARELLSPGGLLVVAVPNFESLQARVGGSVWFHLDVPRHYHHFGLRVLRRLLDEEGFDVERVSHFALEQNPYGWVQSLLNRTGLRPNLLYELLKSESARSSPHPARAWPLQTALTFLALVPVVPLSAALFLLELLLRRGGTVELCARRRASAPG